MTEPCIARQIWARHAPAHDLDTAQGRAAFDNALRQELAGIFDPDLRSHAAETLRRLRSYHTQTGADPLDAKSLFARIAVIEAHLGIMPGAPTLPREITSLRGAKGNGE